MRTEGVDPGKLAPGKAISGKIEDDKGNKSNNGKGKGNENNQTSRSGLRLSRVDKTATISAEPRLLLRS